MLRTDEQWLAIADEFYDAAIDHARWHSALDKLARATGSRSGQLICVGNDSTVPLNVLTNVDPAAAEEFVACGGADPAINPRVKAGIEAPVLKSLAESDFLTPEEHATNRHYREFAHPWDIPFICLTSLERRRDLVIGLSVMRSARQGHIGPEERAVFESLAPHARAAVRMQIALEDNGIALVKGALEGLSLAAFVCSKDGRVQALTSQAEELVRGDRGLTLRNQSLRAVRDEEDRALSGAIARAARGLSRPGAPAMQALIVRGASAASAPLVLDVMPLPSRSLELTCGPRVFVVVRGARGADTRRAALLHALYGFTPAETEIALLLAQGKTTEAIAREREVAVGTVRTQIKSLLPKLGVGRQVELVAKLNEF